MSHKSMETDTTQFCGIAVENAKNPHNIGGIVRSCGCFNASYAVFGGNQWKEYDADWRNMDVMVRRKEMPVFLGVDNILNYVPYDTTIVAIERSEKSVSLVDFKHPRRALYVLGGEDCSVSSVILSKTKHKVHIPAGSLNIAACAYIVLYDREAKKSSWVSTQPKCPICESQFNKTTPDSHIHCITCGHMWEA